MFLFGRVVYELAKCVLFRCFSDLLLDYEFGRKLSFALPFLSSNLKPVEQK